LLNFPGAGPVDALVPATRYADGMTLEKLPVYVNRFPDGRGTLSCAHCAIDAELEGAIVTALYAEEVADERRGIVWQSALTAEQLLGAAADPCPHLAVYRAAATLE
jgi:hypothetical protein